ncbi:ATP-binding protein [Streptomyces polygonati]|uniref:ATP-binding protein n=1 Tax=Streptomyces polygonati TaxID=1617087 RepID=A0ABV8HUT8_9ACTN
MVVRTTERTYRRYRPSVGVARRDARRLAAEWGLPEVADILASVISELVTNAVVHGRAPRGSRVLVTYRLDEDVRLRVERVDRVERVQPVRQVLRVEVRDWATGMPKTTRRPSPEAENGRGLRTVAALTDRWGVIPRVIGKSVWFEIRLLSGPAGPQSRAQPSCTTETDREAHMAQPIYGYMRAYDGTPDEQIRAEEQQLSHWAKAEGYQLLAIYAESDEGSTRELSALIEECNRTQTRAVVVPSFAHFGTSRVLREQISAHVVRNAAAAIHEAEAGR